MGGLNLFGFCMGCPFWDFRFRPHPFCVLSFGNWAGVFVGKYPEIFFVDLGMSILVDNKFSHGETVYLKTDKEQSPRIVFCIKIFKTDLLYEVACGTIVSAHYDFELSPEPNTVFQVQ